MMISQLLVLLLFLVGRSIGGKTHEQPGRGRHEVAAFGGGGGPTGERATGEREKKTTWARHATAESDLRARAREEEPASRGVARPTGRGRSRSRAVGSGSLTRRAHAGESRGGERKKGRAVAAGGGRCVRCCWLQSARVAQTRRRCERRSGGGPIAAIARARLGRRAAMGAGPGRARGERISGPLLSSRTTHTWPAALPQWPRRRRRRPRPASQRRCRQPSCRPIGRRGVWVLGGRASNSSSTAWAALMRRTRQWKGGGKRGPGAGGRGGERKRGDFRCLKVMERSARTAFVCLIEGDDREGGSVLHSEEGRGGRGEGREGGARNEEPGRPAQKDTYYQSARNNPIQPLGCVGRAGRGHAPGGDSSALDRTSPRPQWRARRWRS